MYMYMYVYMYMYIYMYMYLYLVRHTQKEEHTICWEVVEFIFS